MKHYDFTDLAEYNAILRACNVTAETGAPGSKTHRHNGLYYVALDGHGNRVSPPIMASQLPSRPTQIKLDEKYTESWIQREKYQSRINRTLDQEHPSLPSLVSQLQRDGIEIVRSPAAIDLPNTSTNRRPAQTPTPATAPTSPKSFPPPLSTQSAPITSGKVSI
jgi:hypothetical protein